MKICKKWEKNWFAVRMEWNDEDGTGKFDLSRVFAKREKNERAFKIALLIILSNIQKNKVADILDKKDWMNLDSHDELDKRVTLCYKYK